MAESGRNAIIMLAASAPVMYEAPMPTAVPTRLAAIDCEVILAVRSPMFACFVRDRCICARVAELASQETFLPTFASEASSRNKCLRTGSGRGKAAWAR